ncbi:hypothetical protein MMC24_004383 [Lignoscripta atroalba]|nr:hypothetical protein [Lignoscripta atroalba]
MAQESRAVLTPMLVDAYLNFTFPSGWSPPVRQNPAYLAPVSKPDFSCLNFAGQNPKHDIFDHIKLPPYPRANNPDAPWPLNAADPDRTTYPRTGIYLHWSLPRLYRSGIVASDSAQQNLNMQKQQGGYSTASDQNVGPDFPTYREVPNRWLIYREVTALPTDDVNDVWGLGIQALDSPSPGVLTPNGWPVSPRSDLFIVESDIRRRIQDIPASEDLEVTSSPYIDDGPNDYVPGQSFLGRSCRLDQWDSSMGKTQANTVSLTVSRATNPYFADYQPSNCGVFSFFDDLTEPLSGNKYTNANVSYVIIGYHANESVDPLDDPKGFSRSRMDRLRSCLMDIKSLGTLSLEDQEWLQGGSGPALQTICHGSLFNLAWNQNWYVGSEQYNFVDLNYQVGQLTYPGDMIQAAFWNSHPLSVGTNPIDALFGWLKAQTGSQGGTISSTSDIELIKKQLTKIQTLVLDMNDDIDSQLQAEDLLATNNFLPSSHGVRWQFKTTSTQSGTIPTQTQINQLRLLNAKQAILNAVLRENKRLQLELFSQWWTYISDRDPNNPGSKTPLAQLISQNVTDIVRKLQANGSVSTSGTIVFNLTQEISSLNSQLSVKSATEPSFYIQRDPTMFIAGLSSKWPSDFNEELQVRLDGQNMLGINDAAAQNLDNIPFTGDFASSGDIATLLNNKIPSGLVNPILRLLTEAQYNNTSPAGGTVPPEYINKGDRFTNQQGWFPLFIEWEVEYYNIPFEFWEFVPQGLEGRIGYRVKAGISLDTDIGPDPQGDYRVLKGRCPIVPSSSAILEATLKQVFSRLSPDELDSYLSADDRASLLANVKKLEFLSTPMSSFTDQIITRSSAGVHMKPISFSNGVSNPQPISDPSHVANEIGIDQYLHLVGTQTDSAPFASGVSIPGDKTKYSPFKPCLHGQFRFTKLNIIDKFGQIVQGMQDGVNASGGSGPQTYPLFPCVGDSYSVDARSDGFANTLQPRQDGLCPFVQLPPSINQPTRVNAEFVTEVIPSSPTQWRPMDEWENPVQGWIVINYANFSFQIFTPDGQFIREFGIASGKPDGRPFPPDDTLYARASPFLRGLMLSFADPEYLIGFFETISAAVESTQAAPSHYADSMLSILGRPLALVRFGISMQLADPPLVNQCTVAPLKGVTEESITQYEFPLKIGDKDNIHDGLFGYFPSASTSEGCGFDLTTFYSYHAPSTTQGSDPSKPMPTNTTLSPFYVDPHVTDYAKDTNEMLKIFAGVVDPFTAVNCYTALLPIRQLQLPPWTIEQGLSALAAFFKFGPIMIPYDLPPFDSTKVITKDYRLDDSSAPTQTGTLSIPAVGLGEWSWLQPFWDSDKMQTNYNLLGVTSVPKRPLWESGPYTITEGYLQLSRPISKPSATFVSIYQQGDPSQGLAGYTFSSPSDRAFTFDYDSSGKLDHLVLFRPGSGIISILKVTNGVFSAVYTQGATDNGIGGYTFPDPGDQAFAFDYDHSGKLDHLFLYRPGSCIVIILKNVDGIFSPVYGLTDNPPIGIGGWDLLSPTDRAFPFDYDHSGKLDYIVLYRPTLGLGVVKHNPDNSFSLIIQTHVTGLGGYDLGDPADTAFAFDYEGSGNRDYICFYRPGHFTFWIVKHTTGTTFVPVYQGSGSGIGGYDLASPQDQAFAYDFGASGKMNYIVLYRPGSGTLWVLQNQDQGAGAKWVPVYSASSGGFGACGLNSIDDRVFAFDFEGKGTEDYLCAYRPGAGNFWVMKRA